MNTLNPSLTLLAQYPVPPVVEKPFKVYAGVMPDDMCQDSPAWATFFVDQAFVNRLHSLHVKIVPEGEFAQISVSGNVSAWQNNEKFKVSFVQLVVGDDCFGFVGRPWKSEYHVETFAIGVNELFDAITGRTSARPEVGLCGDSFFAHADGAKQFVRELVAASELQMPEAAIQEMVD
ncbi:hypothetical protein LC612_36220 [Nostoc sp. CHAB 5834]|nr:hypothetical protein [Nostoc sp. CHAB 5834]